VGSTSAVKERTRSKNRPCLTRIVVGDLTPPSILERMSKAVVHVRDGTQTVERQRYKKNDILGLEVI